MAFEEDKKWPLKIISFLDQQTKKIDKLNKKMQKTVWSKKKKEEKIASLLEYVNLLKSVQKYYTIAVPLTSYCEKELKDKKIEFIEYAVPIKKLDMTKISMSKDPMKDFAWIKTTYNLIEELKEDEIKPLKEEGKELEKTKKSDNHLIIGLQCAIYIRNRIKELSQKLWYYFEPLALSIASDLKIDRETFFNLTYKEVINSYKKGKLDVSEEELELRKKCFALVVLENKSYILSGQKATEILDFFSNIKHSDEIKGTVACRGNAKGTVKIIRNIKDFPNFSKGDILVTIMTTPDFIVIMKKAAAIVTDEGGLACHAAIVSREMNIPCVIGTKNATRILKDGYFVEVDAEKGIVRKIKK
jgi:phosphoenolpyruvate synthase/pyruvate phosphate dikinase